MWEELEVGGREGEWVENWRHVGGAGGRWERGRMGVIIFFQLSVGIEIFINTSTRHRRSTNKYVY